MEVRWIGAALVGISLLILAILVVAGWFLIAPSRRGAARGRSTALVMPGAVRPVRLLSDSEAAFYWTLRKAVGERWVIAVKVPLAQIMKRRSHLPSGLYTMLQSGHVDFLLLHPRSWEPVIAIELDDTTHETPIRQERDRRKSDLFQLVGIPLLRWRVGESWNVEEIAQAIWRAAPAQGKGQGEG